MAWIDAHAEAWRAEGLHRPRRMAAPLPGGWCLVEGRKLLNFATNDVLGLAHDERLQGAGIQALKVSGTGAGASAAICGRTQWHAALEEKLARFFGQAEALVFPTGYAANVGTIAALAGAEDTIYCDRFNHASLVDGCRLSGARLRVYRHAALDRLEDRLKKPAGAGRRFIVTESLFSMEGDLAPLAGLCDLADRHHCTLIVDEAHAVGVLGSRGRGAAELAGVEGRIDVRTGTLSKALGCLGGFVIGAGNLIDWLRQRARTQVYSTALPPAVCASAAAALDLVEIEASRREALLDRANSLRRRLIEAGFAVAAGSAAHIVPVMLNDPLAATQTAARLEREGFLVAAIRPPTVPRGTSRLRINVSAAHGEEDIARLVRALQGLAPAPEGSGEGI